MQKHGYVLMVQSPLQGSDSDVELHNIHDVPKATCEDR